MRVEREAAEEKGRIEASRAAEQAMLQASLTAEQLKAAKAEQELHEAARRHADGLRVKDTMLDDLSAQATERRGPLHPCPPSTRASHSYPLPSFHPYVSWLADSLGCSPLPLAGR